MSPEPSPQARRSLSGRDLLRNASPNAVFDATLHLPGAGVRFLHGGRRTSGVIKDRSRSRPLISIITVVLNAKFALQRTLDSVLAQTYDNYELIVIDGGSSDGTLDLLKSFSSVIDYWMSEPDSGIYSALNKGLRLAQGDVIGVLNADDTLNPEGLEIVSRYFADKPEIDFLFGAVVKAGKLRSGVRPWKLSFTFRFYTTHSVGFYIRAESQRQLGFYDERYRCSADYDLFYRMLKVHNMSGVATLPAERIGNFAPDGYSSRLSYLDHLFEETRIRINNGQSRIVVLIIFTMRYLRNLRRIVAVPKSGA